VAGGPEQDVTSHFSFALLNVSCQAQPAVSYCLSNSGYVSRTGVG